MSRTLKLTAGLSPDEKRALLERLLREKARRSTSFPLSFAQERLWFLNQLEPGSPFYNVPVAVRLTGRLSIPALKQTLNEIVARHEILRTHFPMVDGLPVQAIYPAEQLTLPLADLSELSEAERGPEVRRLVSQESQHSFDLRQGPLLRINLLRLGVQDHVLILVMHHIISDGWSMGILVREMATLYEAFLRGDASPLPELPIQYADYSVWQREWFQGEALQQQIYYWKKRLEVTPPVLELPTDRPRPAIQSYRGDSQSLELGQPLSLSLKQMSKQEGVRLFMVMLAAFKVLLYRLSGQEDIAVGTPIAGRTRAEIEGLIGFFVNTLVMRSEIKGGHSFKEVMRREKEAVLGAFAHQDVPFEKLVLELQPARSLSYTPLFQVMFAFSSEPREITNLPGLTLDTFEPDLRIAKFDLTLSVIDSQDLAVALEYNTDLFDAATITRMLGHFRNLLEGIAADPEQRISALPLLGEAERRELVLDWNDTAIDYSRDGRMHDLFEAQVERTPNAIALVIEQERVTYAELNRRANQLAHYLQEMGVGPESLVGICLERSIDMIVAVLGSLKAGGAYLPLDPDYPAERLAFIIEDARVLVLLTKRGVAPELERNAARAVWLDREWEEVAKRKAGNPTVNVTAHNLAYVIYTSGSTGRPKGVMIAHHSICNRLEWGQRVHTLSEPDRVLLATSFSFDVSVEEIFAPLIAGAGLVIARPGGAQDPAYLVKLMAEQGITFANFVPSLLQVLLDEPGIDECKHLRLVVAGGEALRAEVKDRFFARTGAELYNLYGPTEASVATTWWRCSPGGERGIVPIGRPLSNLRTYILHADLQLAPIGIPGELHVAGVGLARGYLNRPDRTAEKFIPDPFSDEPGARMYKTGDVARYLEDGSIEFISRVDNQVKIRGFRIELGEIETVLAQCPEVKEAVVLAVDQKQVQAGRQESGREPYNTAGDNILVAYVVPQQDSAPEASRLRGFLENKLPHYMVPSAFVMLDSLPLTPNGKLDRRALVVPVISPLGREPVAPRDLVEFRLARIWQEVMGVDRVGIRDNFFEAGGHSLLAVRLMARIRQSFGKELPLSALFEGATVERLACILRRQAEPGPWSPLVAIQPGGSNPAIFCAHPIGGNVLCYVELARHLGPDQPFYAFQSRGLSGEEPPCTRVEEMASIYIEAMRTVQPEGPYFLGGWSVGGVVAYEMARQLEARGEQVALLVLIDARVPERQEDFMEEDEVTLTASFGLHMGLPVEQINISSDHFLSLGPDERLAYVVEEARKADLMPADITLSQARRLFDVFKANLTAVSNYSPGMVGCRIALMKARERISDLPQELAMGWDELTENGVEVLEVPGNHFTMIHEPHVRLMAERLKSCVDEIIVSERS